MKCFTARDGVISQGIRLLREETDGNVKFFVHVPDDCYLQLSDELLGSDGVFNDGKDLYLMACSIGAGRQLVPEGADFADVDRRFVLGAIGGRMVTFTDEHPEPAAYRTAIGPNSCCHWLYEAKHLNRGPNGHTTGHEEFSFLAVLGEGDSMKATVQFYDDDGTRLKMRAEGPMLTMQSGELSYHRPVVGASF